MAQIAPDDPFVGMWLFDEDNAHYELGAPPRNASYEISTDGVAYTMTMRWTGNDDHTIEQVYNAFPDGQKYGFEGSPGIDSFSMTRVDAQTLDTASHKDGEVVSHARRVLSSDRNTMVITTLIVTPQGHQFTNVATYRRLQTPQD